MDSMEFYIISFIVTIIGYFFLRKDDEKINTFSDFIGFLLSSAYFAVVLTPGIILMMFLGAGVLVVLVLPTLFFLYIFNVKDKDDDNNKQTTYLKNNKYAHLDENTKNLLLKKKREEYASRNFGVIRKTEKPDIYKVITVLSLVVIIICCGYLYGGNEESNNTNKNVENYRNNKNNNSYYSKDIYVPKIKKTKKTDTIIVVDDFVPVKIGNAIIYLPKNYKQIELTSNDSPDLIFKCNIYKVGYPIADKSLNTYDLYVNHIYDSSLINLSKNDKEKRSIGFSIGAISAFLNADKNSTFHVVSEGFHNTKFGHRYFKSKIALTFCGKDLYFDIAHYIFGSSEYGIFILSNKNATADIDKDLNKIFDSFNAKFDK